jgi:hypothetical protein
MAVKYWYRPGNGSSNFNTAGSWFLGPGGTGGATTTPTSVDDAIVNAASGSGTLTISATAACASLNISAFTGTLAGASALNISSAALTNATVLSLGGTYSYTGTITLAGSATNGYIYANSKTHLGPVIIGAG